jgi:hypothetical protein
MIERKEIEITKHRTIKYTFNKKSNKKISNNEKRK